MATKKKSPTIAAAPTPATVAEVNQAFNDTLAAVLARGDVPHVVLLGVLRGLTLNLEAEYVAAQAAARAAAATRGA